MEWDVIKVEVIGLHTLLVQFRDGVTGEMAFKPSFFRGVFAPLIDPQAFANVALDDGGVTWPHQLDLAPDAMHDQLKRHGRWIVE